VISVTQAAKLLGVCRHRVTELCAVGRISGAYKLDPAKKTSPWILPDNPTVSPAGRVRPGKIKLKGELK